MRAVETWMGRYRILGHWSSTRAAEVYAVTSDEILDARSVYALTLLQGTDVAHRLAERLDSIGEVMRGLPDGRIARIHEAFVHGGRTAIVSDLVAGESLAQVLQADRPAINPILSIAVVVELARMLHRAHQLGDRGLVHGDLCPENVVLTYDGGLVLARFGWALAGADLSGDPPVVPGHPGYYAPERAAGETPDAASDVYSLGLILWELLAGQPAITGTGDAELLKNAMRPKVPPLAKKARVNDALERVVMQSIAADKADRFQSAEGLAEALAELKGGRLAATNLRAEVDKLIHRHFAHRARAMATLRERWTKQLSAGAPTREMAVQRRISSMIESAAGVASSEVGARPLAELGALGEAPSDPLREQRTDDLPAGTQDLPRPPARRLSLVGGFWTAAVVSLLLSISAMFWPPPVQRIALRALSLLGQAGNAVVELIASIVSAAFG